MLDNESLSKIGQIKLTVDEFEKELEKNLEFEDKMEQTDCWMGKRNKEFGLMMDWFNAEDACREQRKRRSGAGT